MSYLVIKSSLCSDKCEWCKIDDYFMRIQLKIANGIDSLAH